MKNTSTFRVVLTALFAALVCVATMTIRIPSPTGGYLNLGDGIVLLSAFLLGPVYGTLAAGVGSMLADLLSGYPAYAPGTLAVKALTALLAAQLYRRALAGRGPVLRIAVAGICGELVMALGYFAYTGAVLGYGLAAAAEIPGNLAQGAAGVVVAALLTPALLGSREIREMVEKM
ncbi:MAG: ECF transporter S component [Clostridia bacterium]|nr:ECF transporter S component [Clostridia bacterium]